MPFGSPQTKGKKLANLTRNAVVWLVEKIPNEPVITEEWAAVLYAELKLRDDIGSRLPAPDPRPVQFDGVSGVSDIADDVEEGWLDDDDDVVDDAAP